MSNTTDSDLLSRRRALLGPTYRLFYEEPVHLVSGKGVWLKDAAGKTYLDAYNNVPVVGHCHPHVLEALTRQASQLNTHTRYLTDTPVQLAEKLLATLPSEVSNVVFVCSGTEANDLAVRIAKAVSGGNGVIITSRAYHGTSELIAGMSPGGGVPLGRDVYTVEAPLGANGPAEFGARVRDCVARMKADGIKPAALLVDTFFSSDGIIADPAGFLAEAATEIRKAGGFFIADEVQPGFGRTGDGLWGFARHGIVPDMVTMGKPMGNGHPVAAMAARGELMAEFAKQIRYFNTFGGNTVSCAVAIAVLEVIENEKLVENARTVGAHLKQGLVDLSKKYPALAAIRGRGLYYGVDIHDASGAPDGKEAFRIVNGLKSEGVLINFTGKHANTLKIRPPLPFSLDNSALFLRTLEKVLSR
jgi:4-aminobutyrate aminotransferase-like enzyme